MLIVDAQIHLWGADSSDRPWPPGGAQRAQKPYPVSKDMALGGMKEAGVDRAVIVPPSWEGERNDLALEAARLHPDQFAVMGRFPLEKPDSRPLVDRGLSLCRRPPAHPPRVRRVRSATDVLGNGLDATSLPLAPGRDALHRRAPLALEQRQGMDHGQGHLRMARLAHAPVDLSGSGSTGLRPA